jgi:carbon-monoxide dehydrogenase medium subunit
MRRGTQRPSRVVSIMKLPGLGGFDAHPKRGLEAGAQVKIATLAGHIWVAKRFQALHEAIDQLHPPHIRNMGTLVGNVCSAVPYTDIPPALMALRAELCLTDGRAERRVPIEAFYTGPKQTALRTGELVASLVVPPPSPDAGSAFRKIYKAPRREGDLHKINAAAYVALDSSKDRIKEATVVVGCCGSAPYRVTAVEADLAGAVAATPTYAAAGLAAAKALKPLTRAAWVEEMRAELVSVLVRDVLEAAAFRARAKHDPFEDATEMVRQ